MKDKEIEYNLVEISVNGMPEIGCKMERETVPFTVIAFTGTRALVELLKEKTDTQVFFSTHNTDLLSNDLLRPDAYFEIHDNQIDSFSFLTNKDLRQAHNLKKMYKAGAFSEKSD